MHQTYFELMFTVRGVLLDGLIDVSRYVSVSIKEKKQAEVIFRPLRFNSIT